MKISISYGMDFHKLLAKKSQIPVIFYWLHKVHRIISYIMKVKLNMCHM